MTATQTLARCRAILDVVGKVEAACSTERWWVNTDSVQAQGGGWVLKGDDPADNLGAALARNITPATLDCLRALLPHPKQCEMLDNHLASSASVRSDGLYQVYVDHISSQLQTIAALCEVYATELAKLGKGVEVEDGK